MGWTNWRKIADKDYWYDEELDHEGAACYELAIGGPRGGNMEIKYVGETKNEKERIGAYASHGSHISEIIDEHLGRGFTLYYHAQDKKTKAAAKKMQDNLLSKHYYDWNIQLNVDDED